MLGRNSFLGVAVRSWLALLPKAVGAPSLQVPMAGDGALGSPSWGDTQPRDEGLEHIVFKVPY